MINEADILKLFQLYTDMARELCASMQQVIPDHQKSLLSKPLTSTNFEWLFDLIYDVEPTEEFVFYSGMQWTWHWHGEHCLFESEQGTMIEANISNTDFVDIAFFNHFIQSYDGAQYVLQSIDHLDFNFTASLFDQFAEKNILHQQNGTEFTLVNPSDH
ncbi:hypothetical protein PQ460_07555 [Paenibacillus sp. KACC 21273]|uniref:DUF6896 domain-containing protein n=1 Tax=Paenibacillus sp. KACC 21273 TaxID=3025665 RepID=UPI0023664EA0|nr:hypothetical protein [Paenibacillus sp. KACC 21273]WDF52261.1 hypothetical protein PQ460_07555 [Paenibacillus sp. KACC 21273]